MTIARFNQLTSEYNLFLYNFAKRLTQEHNAAQDLVQDTLLRAFRYRKNYKEGTNFKGWIATIMRNLFVNQYHKNQKRSLVNQPIEDFSYALESKVITPNAGEMNLSLSEIHYQINSLSDTYAIPFKMHFQGYEYKEIANELNIPIGTVKSRIHSARTKLKRGLRTKVAA